MATGRPKDDGGVSGPWDDAPPQRIEISGISIEVMGVAGTLRHGCSDVTGFEFWRPATLAACRALAAHSENLVRGRCVLEFGCGLGVLGIFCAKLGAAHVLLTDKEPVVLRLAALNALTNGVGARCDFAVHDVVTAAYPPWRGMAFDLVVASDILFLDSLARPLATAIESALVTARPSSAPGRQSLSFAVLGHEIRRAIYRGADGRPCLEPEDSALQEFLRIAGPCAHKLPTLNEELAAGCEAIAVLLRCPDQGFGTECDDQHKMQDEVLVKSPTKRLRQN